MEHDFWHQAWAAGRIGFHRDAPLPALLRHWPALALPAGSRVLVPLAGKSLDMVWLAEQGHEVLGIELSPLAISQFFAERGLEPAEDRHAGLPRWRAGPFTLLRADVFAVPAAVVAGCTALYDRAALIALPPEARRRYAAQWSRHLPPGTRMLLVTLDYAQERRAGPPFAVSPAEVEALYGAAWEIRELESRDIRARNPGLAAGLDWLHGNVHALTRRS